MDKRSDESISDAEFIAKAEEVLAELPAEPWWVDNYIVSEGDTPGQVHLYGSDFNDGPPFITALDYGEDAFRSLAHGASLLPELARRLKAKLEQEANWRAEVNRLNHLLANTAAELKREKENPHLLKLDRDRFRREYLGEWPLSESPDYCLCVQPILTVSTTLCGNCGKRLGPLIPTATISSNPDDGGK